MSTTQIKKATQWSGMLRRHLDQKPDLAIFLKQSTAQAVSQEAINLWFENLAALNPESACLSTKECRRVLRQLRERVFFTVMVRDLSGLADLSEVTQAMSYLADLTVEQAYRSVMHDLIAVHGVPTDPATQLPQEMIVIGMGKLGGNELNVSSDIDLVMLYNAEGETPGPRKISNHEFYGKLTRNMMPLISEVDAHGLVFRTDLRLRPDGDVGPLAWSLDAFEQYLFTQGREWERYAWLKGRIIPTQALVGSKPERAIQDFESLRLPFVYRKYFDFDALSALRGLRERIRQDWQRRAVARSNIDIYRNIKLGEGGIREIEFVVQLTQLIRGGKMPTLQQRGLLDALHAQARSGLVPESTAQQLEQAYIFLRRTEHALQYREDEQTHLLPESLEQREALATALNMTAQEFEDTLAHHRTFVAGVFKDAFRMAGLTHEPATTKADHLADRTDPALWVQTHERHDSSPSSSLEEALHAYGSHTENLHKRIQIFLNSYRISGLSNQSRGRIDDLLPLILDASITNKNPERAVLNMLELIENIAQRSAYLALMIEYPDILARVSKIMAASPWAAQYVIQNPIVLDSLIDWRSLMEPVDFVRVAENLQHDLDACLLPDGCPDVEQQMNLMRDTKKQLSFQMLAQDLADVLSIEALADNLSALADLLLAETVRRVWPIVLKIKPGEPCLDLKMGIIAYGKLGGKEIGYSSDLDLVYLFDDAREEAAEQYAKLARRLTSWLSTMTSSGRLYEVDLRLRPDGDAGLLAVSVDAFENYQLTKAWAWEHQAITRARWVAGDADLNERFETIRQKVLTTPRDTDELIKDVKLMRQKINEGHPNQSGDFDLKHDAGGMVDLEFVTQYLVLRYAPTHPALIPNLGNIALLRIASELGLIPQELAQESANAYRNLRRQQHALRLQGAEKARLSSTELATERETIRKLWQYVLEQPAS
jgi:glutamate-ammonia-ligase adenylyltransferase